MGRSKPDGTIRRARTCYDHLAGRFGVAVTDALIREGAIELGPEEVIVTPHGLLLLERLGVEIEATSGRSRRVLIRPCLDWTERRPHIAGRLGVAILAASLERGWVRRMPGTRAVEVTPAGERAFREQLGMATNWAGA